jgi:hypothetical protein
MASTLEDKGLLKPSIHADGGSESIKSPHNEVDRTPNAGKDKTNDSSFKYFMVCSRRPILWIQEDKHLQYALQRVFTYNDRRGWIMNGIAFFCMIAAGTLLPLMDLIFGKFVNIFNGFITGKLSPASYRHQVGRFT